MQPEPSDNRAELMDRAIDLFSAYGYDGVGVQQICDAAAVTKPTLYHHFQNKRGLLETLLDDRTRGLIAPLRELAAKPGAMPETLERGASLTFAFAKKNPAFYRFYLALWFAPLQSEAREVAARFHALHFEAMQAVCRAAMRDEAAMNARVRALTATFLGMLNNAIGLALNDYSALNDRVASAVADQFLNGARARPAPLAKQGRRR